MQLEAKRRAILDLLLNSQGELSGSKLSLNQKRIASEMERDHLVAWTSPAIGQVWTRDYQTLKLTRAGLTALREDRAITDKDDRSAR